MKSLARSVAAACLACAMLVPSAAQAQVPALVNGGFETPDPIFSYPLGWRLYNQTLQRFVGDGLEPPAVTHGSSVGSIYIPAGPGMSNFQGVQCEERIDSLNPVSPRNWPIYTFDPLNNAPPIVISFWFNIPAEAPLSNAFFGLKTCFLRNLPGNFSCYYGGNDVKFVDPTVPVPVVVPGCTVVTLPGGAKGIHTNGQWLKIEQSFPQSLFLDEMGQYFAEPPLPPDPAFLWAQIFHYSANFAGTGVVWVDDVSITQATPATGVCCRGTTCNTSVTQANCTAPGAGIGATYAVGPLGNACNVANNRIAPCCYADFNKTGGVTVQDIFDYLAAWFGGSPYARYAGDGTGGAPTAQSIFDFLAAWFAGPCPAYP